MSLLKGATAGLLLALLTACGGGSSDGSATTTTMTVTPSLGKVQGATVRVFNFQGGVIGQGIVGSSGSVAVNLPVTQNGFVIELLGGPAASYFDEGMGTFRALPAGRSLHAVSSGPRDSVTITAFTEIIYQRARALAGTGALTPALIIQAESELAAIFNPAAGSSYLDIPEVVDDSTDLPDDNSWAGAYALQLAGLARHAFLQTLQAQPECLNDSSCSSLLGFIDAVARDFSDGALDHLQAGAPIGSAVYPGSFSRIILPDVISWGLQSFQSQVQATIANLPLTDRYIGEHFAGNFPLSCTKSAPVAGIAQTAQLTIAADGSFAATGEFGHMVLLAGASRGWMFDSADASALGREATFLASTSPAVSSPGPVSGGLFINVQSTDPTLFISLDDYMNLHIAFLGNGSGEVAVNNDLWQCTGFPVFEQRSNISTSRLRTWLPDGDYQCEYPDYSNHVGVTVSNGVLLLPGVSLSFTAPDLAQEEQGMAGGMIVGENLDHLHAGDAIAQTIAPLGRLSIQLAHAGSPYEISVNRSLATGQGYFAVTGGGGLYKHCVSSGTTLLVSPIAPPPTWAGSTQFL